MKERLASLDILRGADMLLLLALVAVPNPEAFPGLTVSEYLPSDHLVGLSGHSAPGSEEFFDKIVCRPGLVLDVVSIPVGVDLVARAIGDVKTVGAAAADRLIEVITIQSVNLRRSQDPGQRIHDMPVYRVASPDYRAVEPVVIVKDDDNFRGPARLCDQFAIVRTQACRTAATVRAIRELPFGPVRDEAAADNPDSAQQNGEKSFHRQKILDRGISAAIER